MDIEKGLTEEKMEKGKKGNISAFRLFFIFCVFIFMNFISNLSKYTMIVFVPVVEDDYGITDERTFIIETAFTWGSAIFAPLIGILLDRYHRKTIMCVGLFLWIIIHLGISFIPREHSWLFPLMRCFLGIAEDTFFGPITGLFADFFHPDKRRRIFYLHFLFNTASCAAGSVLAAKAAGFTNLNWHWALRIAPLVGIVCLILLIIVMEEPTRGGQGSDDDEPVARTSILSDFKALLTNPIVLLIIAGRTVTAFITNMLDEEAPKYMKNARIQIYGNDTCVTTNCQHNDFLIFGIVICVSAALGPTVGAGFSWLFNKISPQPDLWVCGAGLFFSGCSLLIFLGLAYHSLIAAYVLIFIASMFMNLGDAIEEDMMMSVVSPSRRNLAEGIQSFVSEIIGGVVSGYYAGAVFDKIQKGKPDTNLSQMISMEYTLLVCPYLAMFGGILFLVVYVLKNKWKEKEQENVKASTATISQSTEENEASPSGCHNSSATETGLEPELCEGWSVISLCTPVDNPQCSVYIEDDLST